VSIYRRAKRRDANEPEIVQALRAAGALVLPIDRPADLIAGFKGRWVMLEVKVRRGKLKPIQSTTLAECVVRGLPYYVVRSAEDALTALQAEPRALA